MIRRNLLLAPLVAILTTIGSPLIGTVAAQTTSTVPAPAAGADMVEGFRVITIGVSGPPLDLGNRERTWPATVVQYKDKYFLVDCGGGATHGMVRAGIRPEKVNSVLFTHHHADHNSDYFTFAIGGWNGPSGRRVFNVVGTEGTRKLHEFMLDFYKVDLQYRMNFGFPAEGMFKNVTIREITGDGDSFEIDGVKITALRGVHTIPNLAYRFEAGGQSVVVTGDTALSDNVIRLAKDADILVADAHMSLGDFATRVLGSAQQRANMQSAHMSNDDVAETARRAGVKKLILTHLPPLKLDVDATVQGIRAAGYTGQVVIAETGGKYLP